MIDKMKIREMLTPQMNDVDHLIWLMWELILMGVIDTIGRRAGLHCKAHYGKASC